MKFVLIFGPQAVGKMTVGQELEKITKLKLFHNHITIEMVAPFFNYSTPSGKRLVNLFRREIFKEVASSDLEGLIFTFIWCFEDKKDWEYIKKIVNIFKNKSSEIYYIELEANIKERIRRNKTGNRLKQKPTKRDVKWSENELKNSVLKHRLNSEKDEIKEKNYLRIDNTDLIPKKVGKMIKDKFNL